MSGTAVQNSLTERSAAGRPVVVSRTWQVIGSRDCSAMIYEYDKANMLVTRRYSRDRGLWRGSNKGSFVDALSDSGDRQNVRSKVWEGDIPEVGF